MKIKLRVPTSFPFVSSSADKYAAIPDSDPYLFVLWFLGECKTDKDIKSFDKMTLSD